MPRSAILSRSLFSALFVVGVPDIVTAQQASGVFTVEQSQSGRAFYDRNCAACHGIDLEGSGDAPPLAGGTFLLKWGPKMLSELFGLILQTMPPANPQSLDETSALNATAYILQRNGARAGQEMLRAGLTTRIGAIAGRVPSASVPAQGRGRGSIVPAIALGAGTSAGQGRSGASGRRGIAVAGTVKNYVPVTPEMLKSPPAGDWLIFGRNYQRHSYSPLNQITCDNVKNLQLKWVWAMNDSGANQTTPIVHNGIVYLATPSHIVQALEGRTGDLIWEMRRPGPSAGIRRYS